MKLSIYQIAISLFAWLEQAAAPFNHKIKLGVKGREQTIFDLNRCGHIVAGKPVAWFHAASLGEFEQGRPVMEAFRERYPQYFILLTFFSPSGYEVKRSYPGADYICYLPIDTSRNAARFIESFKPKIAFFIKYEFWFNYLSELKQRGIHSLSFSSIFRPDMIYFKSYGFLHRDMLACLDHLFVQNEESVQLLQSIGIDSCSIAGDTRFDRVSAIAAKARELPEIAQFVGDNICLIAGSVWDADMKVLIPVLNDTKGLKVVIAPHEIDYEQIAAWRRALQGRTLLYSQINLKGDPAEYDFLIIDNVGMLSSLYRYGNFAFIGGAYGAGLHNILEAATFGLPVIFGNKSYHKFKEALDLLERGGAVSVANAEELQTLIFKWLGDPEKRAALGQANQDYVQNNVGATATIMQQVTKLLP